MTAPLQVLYDGQIFEQQRHGGISRYFVELGLSFQEQAEIRTRFAVGCSRNAYLPRLRSMSNSLPPAPPEYGSFLTTARFPGKGPLFRSYEAWWHRRSGTRPALHRALCEGLPDVYHPTYYDDILPAGTTVPMVVTIHDMIHEILPELVPADDTSKRKRLLVEKASRIIAISENTRNDLIRLWGIPRDKIHVIHHGMAPSKASEPASASANPYLLFVGERAGYKNFWPMVKGIAPLLLESKDLALGIVGPSFTAAEMNQAREFGIGERIQFLDRADGSLASHFARATAFVFPSLYEGFGLPLLEAMSHGCPMAISDASSFPEVAGDSAVYFDPTRAESIESTVRELLSSAELRETLRQRGIERSRHFDWCRCAKETLAVYQEAATFP